MANLEDIWKTVQEGFSKIQVSSDLKEKALGNLKRWMENPDSAEDRPQLEYLLEAGNYGALFDAFFRQIPFGTGGRRGPVGFGTNRINPFTIATSAQGHADFLRKRLPGKDPLAVVIAYDVRVFRDLRGVYDRERPNPLLEKTSLEFARLAARVYAANRIRVWFPEPGSKRLLSTPELSFSIRHLKAKGGLNISASHNHPDDNGAKLYNEHGSQESPPLDEEIAGIIERTEAANSIPWKAAVDGGWIQWIPEEVHRAYIGANLRATLNPKSRSARVVFTPLHGTGWDSVGTTLQEAGFDIRCVPEQAQPDGMFPNAPFRSPNPEVPESLGAATVFARKTGADLVLGTDPDADRLGMVVPDPERGWTFLNGNEIGILLAAYMLEAGAASGRPGQPFAITTVVTTTLLRRIMEAYGVRTISDLPVGFKYIAEVMNEVEARGRYRDLTASLDDFVLGFEESHGYLVIPSIRDKDAAGAALLLAEMASRQKERGRSVLDLLDDVYRRFGCLRNVLISTVMQGAGGFLNIRRIQESFRQSPPERISGLEVRHLEDLWDENGPWGKIRSETDRAARDMLIFQLDGDARTTLRPSGTESKNKIYVEVRGKPLGEDASREVLRRQEGELAELGRRIAQEFCLEMLSRIDIHLPRYALEVSDLVPLECKQDFADSLLPELVDRLQQGESASDVESWVDSRLKSYGADGRLLVRRAVASFCETKKPHQAVQAALRELFFLEKP